MAAFLADAVLAPQSADALFSERLIRLPRIPLVYAPPDGMPPVAPLPAQTNGFITFGHFGRVERLNATVIAAWARILHAVPRSRLVLNNRPFQASAFRDLYLAHFASQGIDSSRLDLVYSTPQSSAWAAYGGIDIALDPFPHNAGTTTIEALWQGVPVVSRRADQRSAGWAPALCTRSASTTGSPMTPMYVARAVTAASGVASLAHLRAAAAASCRIAAARRNRPGARHRGHVPLPMERMARGDPARLHRLYAEDNQAAAAELAQQMLRRNAADTEAHHVLGLWPIATIDSATPRVTCRQRHLSTPAQAELHANRAAILRKLGRLGDAEARRAALNSNRSVLPRTTTWATSCAMSAATTKAPTAIAQQSA
jgi:hypothetical protein